MSIYIYIVKCGNLKIGSTVLVLLTWFGIIEVSDKFLFMMQMLQIDKENFATAGGGGDVAWNLLEVFKSVILLSF